MNLTFTPVTLTALPLTSKYGKQLVLLAAGGQNAELFLGLFYYISRRSREPRRKNRQTEFRRSGSSLASDSTSVNDPERKHDEDSPGHSIPIWQHASTLVGSINNNVMLYVPTPRYDFSTPDEPTPRLVVSNNDCTVKFFDVSLTKSGLRRPPSLAVMQHPTSRSFLRRAAGVNLSGSGNWNEGSGMRGTDRGVVKIWRYERVGCLRLPVPVNHSKSQL